MALACLHGVDVGQIGCSKRITGPRVHGPALAAALSPLLFDSNGTEVTENCTVLSKLGIGLDKNIDIFTGLPIFDEEIAGTVHLGFGSSTQFRGPTAAAGGEALLSLSLGR